MEAKREASNMSRIEQIPDCRSDIDSLVGDTHGRVSEGDKPTRSTATAMLAVVGGLRGGLVEKMSVRVLVQCRAPRRTSTNAWRTATGYYIIAPGWH